MPTKHVPKIPEVAWWATIDKVNIESVHSKILPMEPRMPMLFAASRSTVGRSVSLYIWQKKHDAA